MALVTEQKENMLCFAFYLETLCFSSGFNPKKAQAGSPQPPAGAVAYSE